MELLQAAIPSYRGTSGAKGKAVQAGPSSRRMAQPNAAAGHAWPAAPRVGAPIDSHTGSSHGSMEIDMEDMSVEAQTMSMPTSGLQWRDELHRQLAQELITHARSITGLAAILQAKRRKEDSIYSPMNKYTGPLPTESDWRDGQWSVRDCLKMVAKIPPKHPRTDWTFGDGEASFLADFLGLPGEKGARKGREWAKNDWNRAVLTVSRLAQGFGYGGFDNVKQTECEYHIMEVFAIDNEHTIS